MTEHDLIKPLAKAVARKCLGRTVVLGSPALAEALAARGVAASAGMTDEPPRTIICFEMIEGLERTEAERQIDAQWAALVENGVLIICARNADAAANGVPGLHRRKLKDMVERLGKTRTLRSQPFRWVGTINVKGTMVDPDNELRLAATARECRGHVLELGSGRGHLSAAIAATGATVVGIELSACKVKEARSFYPAIEFRHEDILEITPDGSGFDTVVIAEVLEHVPENVGRQMTDIAWSCVAPGGRLLISTPYEDMVPHANHVTVFTADTFKNMLEAYGSVRLCDTQPLRWLLGVVEKPDELV
jgi:SAM-dependent methyltransferase